MTLTKQKWFNQQHIKRIPSSVFAVELMQNLPQKYAVKCSEKAATRIIDLFKERVTYSNEFLENSLVLFQNPTQFDMKVIKKKWNEEVPKVLKLFADELEKIDDINSETTRHVFREISEKAGHKPGQFMQIFRLALTGQGSGPDLMTMIEIMGAKASSNRIKTFLKMLPNQN